MIINFEIETVTLLYAIIRKNNKLLQTKKIALKALLDSICAFFA